MNNKSIILFTIFALIGCLRSGPSPWDKSQRIHIDTVALTEAQAMTALFGNFSPTEKASHWKSDRTFTPDFLKQSKQRHDSWISRVIATDATQTSTVSFVVTTEAERAYGFFIARFQKNQNGWDLVLFQELAADPQQTGESKALFAQIGKSRRGILLTDSTPGNYGSQHEFTLYAEIDTKFVPVFSANKDLHMVAATGRCLNTSTDSNAPNFKCDPPFHTTSEIHFIPSQQDWFDIRITTQERTEGQPMHIRVDYQRFDGQRYAPRCEPGRSNPICV